MQIQLECPGCKALLQVDDTLAGKQGKCVHCGQKVIVPGPPASGTGSSILGTSSPELMMRELSARKQSALLFLFRPTPDGSYDMRDMSDGDLKCIVTDDVNAEKFAQLLASIAPRFSQDHANLPMQLCSPSLYELKGDRLGMSLDEFKRKYARGQEGTPERLPVCSDEAWGANKAALHSEPWHQSAGIVHARIDHPDEDNSPTVGGVKTQLLLYQFLDKQLFRILAYFPTDLFHLVRQAAGTKYGAPSAETQHPRQILWENPVSSVVLSRGTVHPPTPSALVLLYKPLGLIAESRKPHSAGDI